MQGKVTSTGHRGSLLYLNKGHSLSYPWACIILQKGRHKDTPLDKLVPAIIYTHHNVSFSLFQTYFSSLSVLLLCCATENSTLQFTNPYLGSTSFFLFPITAFDDKTAKNILLAT